MFQFLISALAFVVAISILVVIHEYGHFWVARRFGIKVLRFSIGFGKPLLRWYDKLGTEYVISSIPLGGYVAMFGERDEAVTKADRHMSFDAKPVWVRMLVVLAGPASNFLFAIVAYWLVFLMGITVFIPILGKVPMDSPAGLAGLHRNQEIISIDNRATPSWEAVSIELLRYVGEDQQISVKVKDRATHKIETRMLDLESWGSDDSESNWLEELGFVPMDPFPAVVGKVLPDHPASVVGLQSGDRIVSIDGQPIYSRTDVVDQVQTHPGQAIPIIVLRGDKKLSISIEPLSKTLDTGEKVGFIGVEFVTLDALPVELSRVQRFSLWPALTKSIDKTVEYSVLTLQVLKKMVLGKMSVRHINGPLAIAEHAGKTAVEGMNRFIDFLGLISVSLGVLNLLPIPLLDGGHFAYCVYEVITGRRVPELAQKIGLWLGGSLLLSFMLLAFYNDITHLLR